ncbi:MAG: hypothetical protein NTZ05_06050 [Chloroflexi bacterium]|nr:hypothetical protein [Chloroflexota bacterium]
MTEPGQEQWKTLFAVAEEFRRAAPWRWMSGDELFAVEHPDSGETGYCVVMGNAGQEFGLSVFVGAEGFESYRKLMAGEVEPESFEGAAAMRSVAVSFGPREVLQKRDHEIIRSLGLRFRGRDVWPWFRSQRPGYAPWYLDPNEVGLLEVALRQGMDVAHRFKSGELRLTDGMEGTSIFTRRLRQGVWGDEWRKPARWESPEEQLPPPDPERLQRPQQSKRKGRDRWQLDLSLIPMPVGERNQRPYYPVALLVVNEQGLIVGNDLLEPWTTPAGRQSTMLHILETAQELPQEIQVDRDEVRQLLEPVAKLLGITVRLAALRGIQSVKAALLQHFG